MSNDPVISVDCKKKELIDKTNGKVSAYEIGGSKKASRYIKELNVYISMLMEAEAMD